MIREYEDRRDLENFYEKAKKRIKEQIELKGVSMKGSAKGGALSEIINVLDDSLCIDMAQTMLDARKQMRTYCRKYDDIERLNREYREAEERLNEQKKVADMASMLTDDVLKNAIIAYNAIKEDGRYNKDNAKDIVIAYINSKGRSDIADMMEAEDGN